MTMTMVFGSVGGLRARTSAVRDCSGAANREAPFDDFVNKRPVDRAKLIAIPRDSLPAVRPVAPSGRVPLLVDFRLELVQVPVSDVDRAKAFYTEKVGFNADHDHRVTDELRFVQLTPPGSGCSIALGTGLSKMPPGSVEGLQLVVSDIHAAREELVARGVEVSEVQNFPWGSFVFFSDPDGNGWAVQQIPSRD
jgi:predicted enzyme related to lactoylglutathione lyase